MKEGEQPNDKAEARRLRRQALARIRCRRDGVADFLTVCARFRRYSLSNVLLIYAQRPYARVLASREVWSKLGRQVRPDEKGVLVRAPVARKEDEQPTKRTAFEWRVVFDIGQTEGAELSALAVPTATDYVRALQAFAESHDIATSDAPMCKGSTGELARLIYTVSAELAKRVSPSVLDRILDAQAVAVIVMRALGLPVRSDGLVNPLRMDDSDLADSMDRAHTVAKMILEEIKPLPKRSGWGGPRRPPGLLHRSGASAGL